MGPDVKDIERAGEWLKGVIQRSPLVRSRYFSRMLGAELLLKLENLQETGAFKVRRTYNRLSQLQPEERRNGVFAASGGNLTPCGPWFVGRVPVHRRRLAGKDTQVFRLIHCQSLYHPCGF